MNHWFWKAVDLALVVLLIVSITISFTEDKEKNDLILKEATQTRQVVEYALMCEYAVQQKNSVYIEKCNKLFDLVGSERWKNVTEEDKL